MRQPHPPAESCTAHNSPCNTAGRHCSRAVLQRFADSNGRALVQTVNKGILFQHLMNQLHSPGAPVL